MAAASTAIETVAEAGGFLKATVFRAARALREADATLWPQGSQGRGRAAQVYPSHLTNLLLAMSSDPITHAAVAVREMRQFVPIRNSCEAFPDGIPLGRVLDKRINDIACGNLPGVDLYTKIDRIGERITTVTLREWGEDWTLGIYLPPDRELSQSAETAVVYSVSFQQAFLDVLAALWNDTKRELSLNTDYSAQEG